MDLKNIQISDLKEKILAVADKKTLIKFGIGFGSIVLFLIVYYAILNPMVKERKAKYEDQLLKQNEISQFENDITSTIVEPSNSDYEVDNTIETTNYVAETTKYVAETTNYVAETTNYVAETSNYVTYVAENNEVNVTKDLITVKFPDSLIQPDKYNFIGSIFSENYLVQKCL